jgi:hypothetical protein
MAATPPTSGTRAAPTAAAGPVRTVAASLAQAGLDRGRHLVRAMPGPIRAVGQDLQPARPIAAQPAMDRLAADPVALSDLDQSGRTRRRMGGHVNHQPEHWNPSAGLSTTTINRVRGQGDVGALPEICQKLRHAQPHVPTPRRPQQHGSPRGLRGDVRLSGVLRTTRASMAYKRSCRIG